MQQDENDVEKAIEKMMFHRIQHYPYPQKEKLYQKNF